jgi:hypothetical protein
MLLKTVRSSGFPKNPEKRSTRKEGLNNGKQIKRIL